MPYPFGLTITLEKFIARVTSEYNAELKNTDGILTGPHGQEKIQILIKKEKNGKKRIAVVPNLKVDEYLVTTVLRSLCQQLHIPPQDFGLYLG